MNQNIKRMIILTVVVCAAVFVVYFPALSSKAFSIDDDMYFINNPLVRNPSWQSVRIFLSEVLEPSTVKGYYQPLTMISLMLDCKFGGRIDNLMPFHLTSLMLHIANTALIIFLLYELFGQVWIAAAVGLLFGVHPLTVEPIPWISERKALLAAFFALASLVFYVRFAQKNNRKAYIACFLMYILALMSKPTSTPLPLMMLLMDFWPLRRLKLKTVFEKIPLFAIGVVSAAITYISQNNTTLLIKPQMYGMTRIPLVICHNIIFYLYKIIWPVNLSYYPFPEPFGISSPMVITGIIGTCILIAVLIISLRWTKAPLTGWLIFFVMIFPTMQLFQFSGVIASDNFAYLPFIGILLVLAAFFNWIYAFENLDRNKIRCVIAALIILVLAGAESFATRQYLADWKDTISLFTRMARLAPNSLMPLNHLGAAYFEKGDLEKSAECFKQSLKIKPDTSVCNNLGAILTLKGDVNEALEWHGKAIQLDPGNAEAYYNISNILLSQNKFDKAVIGYKKALSINPRYVKAKCNLAVALMQQGLLDEAIIHLAEASKMDPDNIDIHYNLAMALTNKGLFEQAVSEYRQVLRLNPMVAEAYSAIGDILAHLNRPQEAIIEYRQALEINPQDAQAQQGLTNLQPKQ